MKRWLLPDMESGLNSRLVGLARAEWRGEAAAFLVPLSRLMV